MANLIYVIFVLMSLMQTVHCNLGNISLIIQEHYQIFFGQSATITLHKIIIIFN